MHYIDMRSDTVTLPTQKMLNRTKNVLLGDDLLGEDPTVKRLESLAARMFKKEAALFTVSGTMSNQIAVMTFTKRGQEVIVGKDSHMYNLEVGGLSALSQVQVRPIDYPEGAVAPEVLEREIRTGDLQVTETGLVCLENPYNLNKGLILELDNLAQIRHVCNRYGIPIYMDGARIFNAAIALDIDVSEIAKFVDAVQVCLTKGLSAPVGSLLIGDYHFIERARVMRQRLGGGMRQAGILAGFGIESLENMVSRLHVDNMNAKKLAIKIQMINNNIINLDDVQTNIISIDLTPTEITEKEFIRELDENGIKIKKIAHKQFRMVTHRHITEKDIKKVVKVFRNILRK